MFTRRVARVWTAPLVTVLLLAAVAAGCAEDSIIGPGPVGPIEVEENPDAIAGSGDVIVESRSVAGFDRIALLGEGQVMITRGVEESLDVETDDNLLEYIETRVDGDVLVIETQPGVDIDPTRWPVYRVGMNEVVGIELAGAGSIEVGPVTGSDFLLELHGVGDILVEALDATTLNVDFDGVGSVEIDGGAVADVTITASGVGIFEAPDLRVEAASIDVRGTAAVTVWVAQALDVTVSDDASCKYYGDPAVTSEVNDLGTLTSLGDK